MQSSAPLDKHAATTVRSLHGVRPTVATTAFLTLAGGLFGVLAWRRWEQIGRFVPGVDSGNWFAFGRGLLGGPGKSTGGTYPPLVPVLMQVGRLLLGVAPAARLLAVGSLVVAMTAMLFVASRGINRWLALALALAFGLSNVVTEPSAFGGYAQNIAVALLLLAGYAFAAYLVSASARWLGGGANLLLGAALTHHAYYVLACLITALVWVLWLTSRPPLHTVLRRTLNVSLATLPSLLCFLPTLLVLRRDGYGAPINATNLNIESALRYAVVEAPWLWLPVIATGTVYALFSLRWRCQPLWLCTLALLLAASLFVPTREPRLAPLLIGGALLATGLAIDALRRRSQGTAWMDLPLGLAIAFPLLLTPFADSRASDVYQYYRVDDASLQRAAAWVDGHRHDGNIAVRHDARGWPIGWWFEGLTQTPILVGSNEQWLAFPRERTNSRLVATLFDEHLDARGVRALASRHQIRYLVLRKWDWIGWQSWTADINQPLFVAFDDGEFLILDAGGG